MISSTVLQPSHSRLSSLHQCRRKYFYHYFLGLRSKQDFPPAFAGSCGHVGLDVWHRTGDKSAALAASAITWGPKRFHGDWDFLTAGHLDIVLQQYMESLHTQDWEVVRLRLSDLRSDRLLATDVTEAADGYLQLAEASFVVDVPGLGPVNVRPDLLLRGSNGLRMVDHKFTTSYLGSKMYNQAKFGHQLRLYALAMAALTGEPVLEGSVNGIYMGSTASSDKFKGKRFDSYTFDYSESDFAETKAWYRRGVEEMKEMDLNFTPADELEAPQSPSDKCGYCDYSSLCGTAPAYRPALIKLNFARSA
jgi:hypothetical protein